MPASFDPLSLRRVLPFAAAAGLALVTALIPPSPDPRLLAVAGAIVALLAVCPVAFAWARPPAPLSVLPPLLFLLVVVILRDATGGSGSGFAPLVLLSVFWVALYGERWQLALVIVGVGAVFAAPLTGVLGGEYRSNDVRYAIILLSLSSLIGFTAQGMVSRLRNQQRDLSEQRDFLDAMFDSAGSLVTVLDLDGRVLRINPACERIGGFAAKEMEGRPFWELLVPEEGREAAARGWAERGPERLGGTIEVPMVSRDGSRHVIHWTLTTLHDQRGEPAAFVATGLDVTEERAAESALAESEYRFRTLVEHLPDAIVSLYDQELRCRAVEGPMLERQGIDPEQFLGRTLAENVPAANVDVLRTPIEAALGGCAGRVEYESERTGAVYDVDVVPYERGGEVIGAFLVSRDVTERKRFERELKHLAEHDSLTGLLNRRRFEGEIARHLAHIARYGEVGALIVFDIDGFKSVNDTLGHAKGDELLREVAISLGTELRRTDRFGRLGGDEFAILLPEADCDEAEAVAERLVTTARRLRLPLSDGGERGVAISVGVVTFSTADHLTPEQPLTAADLAMYEAKRGGGDGYRLATAASARA